MAEAEAEAKVAVVNQGEVAVEPYEADKDIMMNITLYKKVDEKNYKIYIDGNINVTKPGEKNPVEVDVPDQNRLVSDSKKNNEDNNDFIKVITNLINETDAAPAQVEDTAEKTEEGEGKDPKAVQEIVETPAAENTAVQNGGYSSKSVSFRPFKKRRTVKKRRGRK